MQQPSVTDYFKVKKRICDDSQNLKPSKLMAVSASSEDVGGVDCESPNPIRTAIPAPSPKVVEVEKSTESLVSNNIEIDRKTAKGKRRVPCFKRYHHLISNLNQEDNVMAPTLNKESQSSISSSTIKSANETPGRDLYAPNLPLPYKYNILLEIFRALETVSSIFFNRNEVITFNKVRPAVLELVRTTQLREKHLAQILTIFPNSYTFVQERVKTSGLKEIEYQLIITPNLKATSSELDSTKDGKMSASLIAERRKVFEDSLIQLCYKYHKEFLLSLNPPIVVPSGKRVTRWHHKFQLNEIPDIELSEIPKAPEIGSISASTAKDVITRAQNIMEAANPRMKKALQELMKKTVNAGLTTSTPPAAFLTTTSSTATPSRLITAADNRAATKTALLKAQQALMQRAKDNPKMRDALNNILVKNNEVPIPGLTATIAEDRNVHEEAERAKLTSSSAPITKEKGNPFNKKTLAALKGVSQSLIDKIRAREQEKSIRCMTLTPEETTRRAMLNRLPEFVKIVRNMMVAEKKSVLALHIVVDRLSHSHYRSLTDNEVENHVRLLQATVPEWLSILNSTQGEFVKIIKDVNTNEILEKINELIKMTK